MNKVKWKSFLFGAVVTLIMIFGGNAALHLIGIDLFLFHSTGASAGRKIDKIAKYIDEYYWEDASEDDMENGILKGMVASLGDKYSNYYTDKEYETIMSGIKGTYTGIGAVVAQKEEKGDIIIKEVNVNGAAERAGIKAGDIIIGIDGENVTGQTLDEVIRKVKGEDGSIVVMSLLRENENVECTVAREEIKNVSVTNVMLENNIGYIRIADFDDESPTQFDKAIKELDEQGQVSLIIDLRDNGGGSLPAVVKMMDRMLSKGLLVTIKEKNKKDEVYEATDEEVFNKPCIVLINGNSASASEVFAGAMQDRGAAKLVGTKSFGKGIVQTIFSLKDSCGGALKLTVAKYFLPSGRCIHEVGLDPDVVVEKEEGTDNQLAKAIEELVKSE